MTGSPLDTRRRFSSLAWSALREAVAVVGTAARLLWQHWPVLVALFLAGIVAHELLIRLAVEASAVHAVLGFLILLLAPIATLVAFILMLRTLRPSLPWLSRAAAEPAQDGPRPGLLNQLGSVLAPFLTVYVAYGHLARDVSDYVYRVWEDEALIDAEAVTEPGSIDVLERLPVSLGVAIVSVVLVALALRWLVDRWEATKRRPWLGLPAAYAEIVWIGLGGVATLELSTVTRGWLEARRVVHWLSDVWDGLTGKLGPLTGPVREAGSWLWGLVTSSLDDVIVVPIAWLVVGAVVYGHQIAPQPPEPEKLARLSRQRWSALPSVVHRINGQVGALLLGRFSALAHGIRLIFRAGLAPMLLFCLAFIIAEGAQHWLWEAERLVIGPRDLGTFWMPWSRPLGTFNSVVGWTLLACLLGAAIDRVLRVAPPATATPSAGRSAEAPQRS